MQPLSVQFCHEDMLASRAFGTRDVSVHLATVSVAVATELVHTGHKASTVCLAEEFETTRIVFPLVLVVRLDFLEDGADGLDNLGQNARLDDFIRVLRFWFR